LILDESATEEDILDEEHGVKILTENKWINLLEGAVIDYVENDDGADSKYEPRRIIVMVAVTVAVVVVVAEVAKVIAGSFLGVPESSVF
jgi:preprotein translocase subunit Sec61beta